MTLPDDVVHPALPGHAAEEAAGTESARVRIVGEHVRRNQIFRRRHAQSAAHRGCVDDAEAVELGEHDAQLGAGEVRFMAWSAAIAFASGSTTVAVPSGCWQFTS